MFKSRSFKAQVQGQFNLLEGLAQNVVMSKYEDNPLINYQVFMHSTST
jgi:hypothetical protein